MPTQRLPWIAPSLRAWLLEAGYVIEQLRPGVTRCADCGRWLYTQDEWWHVCLNARCPLNTPMQVTAQLITTYDGHDGSNERGRYAQKTTTTGDPTGVSRCGA